MKRIFNSDKQAEMLISEHIGNTDDKISKMVNVAIKKAFLPRCQTLFNEAGYLLQLAAEGAEIEQFIIKQCISRGLSWLGKYPIENPELLKTVLLHFTRSPWENKPGEPANDYVNSKFAAVIELIQETEPDYKAAPIHPYLGNFGEEILDRWATLWNHKATYNALSAIVFCEEPAKPFTWFDGVCILQSIEAVAEERHGVR